jgi:hypothetical protein
MIGGSPSDAAVSDESTADDALSLLLSVVVSSSVS